MKLKLTPALAYIVGLWTKRRSFEGLGIKASPELMEIFTNEVIAQGMTTKDKIISDGKRVFFYHTAYKRFFSDIVNDQFERFKYLNEYAGNYLAGLFDSVGDISEDGIVSFTKLTNRDELLLLRLGFNLRRKKESFVVEKPVIFLAFIKNYVKLYKGHKIFDMLEKLKKK